MPAGEQTQDFSFAGGEAMTFGKRVQRGVYALGVGGRRARGRRKRKPSSPIHTKQKMTIESKALVMSRASVQPFACAAMMLSAAANPTADEQDETANPKGTTASAPVGLRAAMLARTENMSA